jgi:plasmid stabilization system protein ParE
MSARSRYRLTIRESARRDIDDVLLYTRTLWGADQRRRYGVTLKQAIRTLVDFPELGSMRDDLFLGCRNLLVERHVVYYQIRGDEIIVGRVFHISQNPEGKVTP